MNMFEWQGQATESASKRLAHFVRTTREDWLEKCPKAEVASETRSIMDQVSECIRVNRRFTAMLEGCEVVPDDTVWTDPEEACSLLADSASRLAAVIAKQDDSVLGKIFDLSFGQFPGAAVISIPAWNMIYHAGQVNYVQRLYGDIEFHRPPM